MRYYCRKLWGPPTDCCVCAVVVLKQRREADTALFSELHRKLQTQVCVCVQHYKSTVNRLIMLFIHWSYFTVNNACYFPVLSLSDCEEVQLMLCFLFDRVFWNSDGLSCTCCSASLRTPASHLAGWEMHPFAHILDYRFCFDKFTVILF